MDALADLFALPADIESNQDRYYGYPNSYWFRKPYKWRKRELWRMISEHGYDNIPRVRAEISDCDIQIARLSKGACSEIRTRPHEAKKQLLVERLKELENGWTKIAQTMTEDSQKLFGLPREVREKIYGYLYTKEWVIDLNYPDIDVRHSLLPSDPYGYLNAEIVDPAIAAEAAQVLYDMNTFSLRGMSYLFESSSYRHLLPLFLDTDHYGSGVIPRDIIRRLHITIGTTSPEENSHAEYEALRAENERTCRMESREQLSNVLNMQNLRLFTIELEWPKRVSTFEFREFSPLVRILKEKGVAVKVVNAKTAEAWRSGKMTDFSRFFDIPTAQEWNLVNINGGLSTWKPGKDGTKWGVDESVMWKCYLDEHYQVVKEKERVDEIFRLEMASMDIDAILSDL